VALFVVAATALVGVMELQPIPFWVAGAVGVCAVVSVAFDAWGGALVGLAAAVLLVYARRASGYWSADLFAPAMLETFGLIVVGAVTGQLGSALRTVGKREGPASAFEPVYGSLGLLGREAAFARLEEEVARATRLNRAVHLAVFHAVVTDDALPPEGREAALRAVARVVEGRAQEHDVPFAFGPDRLGIVFLESTLAAVWDVVGRILDAAGTATFAYGAERSARSLAAEVELFVGISQQSPSRGSATALVDDAVDALNRARSEVVAP
jgi:GGDEF domain-containing protein